MLVKGKWKDNASKAGAVVGVVSAIVSLIIGLIGNYTGDKFSQMRSNSANLETINTISSDRYNELQKEIIAIKSQLKQITNINQQSKEQLKTLQIDQRLAKIDSQLDLINRAILASPEKVLEIPMLKRDIVALQNEQERANKSLEREISTAYETMKWVIGTIILGILGLAASVLLKDRQKS